MSAKTKIGPHYPIPNFPEGNKIKEEKKKGGKNELEKEEKSGPPVACKFGL